jgi:prevent-host-death family protein
MAKLLAKKDVFMDARTTEFAASEAKARFSELLDRAEAGENIVIRRHGRAVARMTSAQDSDSAAIARRRQSRIDYVNWLKVEGPTLGADVALSQLIAEGRRY